MARMLVLKRILAVFSKIEQKIEQKIERRRSMKD